MHKFWQQEQGEGVQDHWSPLFHVRLPRLSILELKEEHELVKFVERALAAPRRLLLIFQFLSSLRLRILLDRFITFFHSFSIEFLQILTARRLLN